jgi:hypothetical protein
MENEGYFSFGTIKMSLPILNAHSLTNTTIKMYIHYYNFKITAALHLCYNLNI